MSRIELSASVPIANLMTRAGLTTGLPVNVGTGVAYFPAGNAGAATGRGFLNVMKGTIPATVADIYPTWTRQVDVLASWDGNLAAVSSGITTIGNIANFTLPYVAAIASGAATWFCIVTRRGDIGTSTISYHGIYGTVGLLGSGADLEVPDVNVVSGGQYRILNFKLSFPTIFDY